MSEQNSEIGVSDHWERIGDLPHMRKLGDLKDGIWKKVAIPEWVSPPSMLLAEERQLLYYLASRYFEGKGAIIDAGAFLGGSTTALAIGAEVFFRRAGKTADQVIHSYDLFTIEQWTIGRFFPESYQAGGDFYFEFEKHLSRFRHLVNVHRGDICKHPWSGGDIEILFIDCAKHPQISDFIVRNFFGSLIPLSSIVIQQDFLYHSWSAWLPITMEYYSEYFEVICHTDINSVAFLYKKKIPADKLNPRTVMSLDVAEQRELSEHAIARFSGNQRTVLRHASEEYFGFLNERGKSWFDGLGV